MGTRHVIALTLALVVLLTAAVALAQTSVKRIVITRDVENHEPVEAAHVYPADVGQLYCFTEIITDHYPTNILHIWLHNGEIMAEVPLTVESPTWRTFSAKNILPEWTGDWKVEVFADNGKLIGSVSFTVTDPNAPDNATETGK